MLPPSWQLLVPPPLHHDLSCCDLADQLEAFGAAVCAALPVAQCCNYHGCSNAAGHSELELVGGKSCVCGGCRTARYCSAACQKAQWKHWHKAVCKAVQHAAAAAGAAAAAALTSKPGSSCDQMIHEAASSSYCSDSCTCGGRCVAC